MRSRATRRRKSLKEQNEHTFGSALLAVRLHGYVGVQVVQGAIGLLATVPAALVHALDFLVTSTGTLVLLGAGDGDEGVDLRERMLLTISGSQSKSQGTSRHGIDASRLLSTGSSASTLVGGRSCGLQRASQRDSEHPLTPNGLAVEVETNLKCLLDRDGRQLGLQRWVSGLH